VLAVVGVLVVAPIGILIIRASVNGGAGFRSALKIDGIGGMLRTTAALAIGSVVIAMTFGTTLAWMAHRLPRRARWMSTIPVLPIVIPATANILGWTYLLSPRSGFVNRWLRFLPWWHSARTGPIDIYSTSCIVLITGISLTAFVYVFVRSGLRRYNFELTEAAYVCGASPRRTFLSITLPLMRPSLVYAASISLLLGLGQFTAPLLLGTRHNVRVVTTEMYRFISRTGDFDGAAAIATPLLLVGILFVFLQRRMLTDSNTRYVTQGKGTPREAQPSRLAVLVIGVFGILFVALPLLALIVVGVSPAFTGEIAPSTWTLDNFRVLFDNKTASNAIENSLIVAVGGVVVALVVGYLIADVLYRARGVGFVRSTIDVIVNLPLGVPAVVFGAGFLYTYTKGPVMLYGTRWVIILVYLTLMLPFTTRLQLAARTSLGNSFEEAAAVCGAGVVRTHTSIVLPLTRTSLSGAAAIMFVLLTHEFAASLLVRSIDSQVMGTVLYNLLDVSSNAAAAMALVMCIVTTIGVTVAMWAGGGTKTLDRL